jgi:hypothetical protein
MGASICCAEAEADTQFTIFDLSALKKQYLIKYAIPNFNSDAQTLCGTDAQLEPGTRLPHGPQSVIELRLKEKESGV